MKSGSLSTLPAIDRSTSSFRRWWQEEKERIRAERERQPDEDAARKEFERERTRLAKEKAHCERVQAQRIAAGEDAEVGEAADKLEQLSRLAAATEWRVGRTAVSGRKLIVTGS